MNQATRSNSRKARLVIGVFGHLIAQALLAGSFLLFASLDARCATETWNPGGAGGGNGIWDSGVTANWNSGQTWSTGSDALFSGTGGTVTLVNPSANSLTFSASGPYLLQSGTLTLTGGNLTVNSDVTISSAIDSTTGLLATGTGTLTLTGITNLGSNALALGLGTVNIANGATVSDEIGYIGDSLGSSSIVTVSGTGTTWTNAVQLYIGVSEPSALLITNGGSVSAGLTTTVSFLGTLELGENPTLNGPLTVNGGTVALVGGVIHEVTLTSPATISAGSNLDFEVGNGSDEIALSGSGSLEVTGAASINLFTLPGLVTSGTDVLISGVPSANLSLGALYNSGNFTYSLVQTGSSEDVVVTAASALTTAYWTGSQNNIWSVLEGGLDTNWSTDAAGYIDPHLTPSATTDVIFSAATAANEGDTILGTDMTIKSLTVSDPNAVTISGSEPILPGGTSTLTISGSTGITIDTGAGPVTIGANLYLSGSSQSVAVENAAGLFLTGSLGGSGGMIKSGTGTLTLTGAGNFGGSTVDTEAGTLTIECGGLLSNGNGYIGEYAGSNGTVMVSGGGSTWTNNLDLYAGESGSGTLLICNGGAVSNGSNGYIGANAGSGGTVTVSGSGSTWTNNLALYVGESGSGTLLVTNGGAVSNGSNGYIGANAGSGGTVTVSGSGSTWSNAGRLYIGGSQFGAGGAGILTIDGGGTVGAAQTTVWTSGTLAFGENASLNSPLNVNGGTVTLVDGQLQTVTLTNPVTIGAGSNLDFEVGDGSDEIALSGSGSLDVTGATAINLFILPGQVTGGLYELLGGASSYLSLGDVYNGGNFTYTLLASATSEYVFVTPAAPLTTAYWKGGKSNVWSVLVDGSSTNWATTMAGTTDTHLTPSATTNVIFSANAPANEGDTVLGTDIAINSLTVSDTNVVMISGSNPLGTNTLTISGTSGTTGITVNSGAGAVTIGANVYLTGNSQTVTVNNAAGLLISGILGASNGLVSSGRGTLALTGNDNFGGGSVDAENGTLAIRSGGAVTDSTGYVGNNAGSSGMVTVSGSGSAWTNSSDLYVGNSGTGTLLITSGGAVSNGESIYGGVIGNNSGSSGMVTVSGSGSTWTDNGDLTVGGSGSGTLLIAGEGVVYSSESLSGYGGVIGDYYGSTGTVTVTGTGSTWNDDGELYVGQSGSGTLLITNGGAVASLDGEIGGIGYFFAPGIVTGSGAGMVTVSGSGSIWSATEDISVGNSGNGTLLITGGGVASSDSGYIGDSGTGTVTVSGSGSMWNATDVYGFGGLYVGVSGNGTLLITGGGVASSDSGFIGDSGTGTVTVSGSGSMWNDTGGVDGYGGLYVGAFGIGTLQITGGGSVSDGSNGYIGLSGSGTVAVSGSGSTWTNSGDLSIGNSGTGTLLITGGGSVSNANGYIGKYYGIGTVTVSGSGSTWTNNLDLYVGDSGTGTLLITGGGSVFNGNGYIGANAGSGGTVTVSGSGSTWNNANGLYIGGNQAGAGGAGLLTINGGGTVNAAQTTVWTGGTLAFGENASLNSPLNVNGGTVTLVDGQLQTVTLTNPVTIGEGSTLDFEVGNGSDEIAVSGSGSIEVTGAALIDLFTLPGLVTSGTDVLISGVSSGNLSLGALYNSGNFTYSLLQTSTSEDVIVKAAPALTTAYWEGGQNNIWSILEGGTATNWTTNQAGTIDPQLTPSATTNVIFSADDAANEGDTVLGTDMTIKSLTVNDPNVVEISGSNPQRTNTLTISGTAGNTGITINTGAGPVTIGANLFFSGSSQSVAVENAAGLLLSGSVGGRFGLYVGGNSSGPVSTGVVGIEAGGSISDARTTIWNTGTLAFDDNAILDGPLNVEGGSLILAGGQEQTLTLTSLATISAGSTLDLPFSSGAAAIALSGTGSLRVTGPATLNLYDFPALLTSGTDVLIAAATGGNLSLRDVYNSGNFTYSLLSTATSEDVVVKAAPALTTAYWEGGQNNIWSILVGDTATNWTIDQAGTIDPHLTPSATTDVIFSADNSANEGDTVLGTDMTIQSLTVNDPNPVEISGSNPQGTNTLTISGSTGITGITINGGAGPVTIDANLYLGGNSQYVIVDSAAGLLINGDIGGSDGLVCEGIGTLTLTGNDNFGESAVYTVNGNLVIQNGGAVFGSTGYIYGFEGSSGTVVVSGTGSTWTSSGDLDVGEFGNGTLLITGGGTVYNDNTVSNIGATIGEYAGSSGMVTVTGTNSTWTDDGDLTVGYSGTGALLIESGGAVTNTSDLYGAIGEYSGSRGTVTVTGNGSTWTDTGDLYVGQSGTGMLLVTNGGVVTNDDTNIGASIGEDFGSSGMVTVSGNGSAWIDNGDLTVGQSGTGTLLIESGGAATNGYVYSFYQFNIGASVGANSGSRGTVTVTGNGSTWTDTGNLYVGESGTGTLLITNGGVVTNGDTNIGGVIGANYNGTGTVTVTGNGSTWTDTGDLYVGESGTGTLLITNGGVVTNGDTNIGASIGDFLGSSGMVTVEGNGSAWTDSGNLYVGQSGTGALLIENGGAVTTGGTTSIYYNAAFVGENSQSNGMVTVTGNGSTWTDNYDLYVGESGTGTLLIENGGAVTNGGATSIYYNAGAFVGENSQSSGTVTVTGNGSTWTDNGNLYVGESGTGTLLIENGGAVTNGGATSIYYDAGAFVGENSQSSGTVTVTGNGSTWTDNGDLYVGESGTGTLLITNGGVVTNGFNNSGGVIGGYNSGTGTVTVSGSGSAWIDSGDLTVGQSGTGTLLITDGGVVTNGYDFYGAAIGEDSGSRGAVTVTGIGSSWTDSGYLYVGESGTGTLLIANGGSVSDFIGSIGQNYFNSNGAVTVSGSGSTWINTAALDIGSYFGGGSGGLLTIANGGLVSAEQTSLQTTGTLAFGENATLNSSLSVSGGTVTLVDGQIQTVTLTKRVTISAGSNLDFEVGNGSDQLALSRSGLLSVSGTAAVNLYGLSGLVVSGTDVLITPTSPTISLLGLGAVYNSGNFTYNLVSTSTSEEVIVTATTALDTAYWKGGQDNIWSILVGGTATNWTTSVAGITDTDLTPSATTDVIFSANTPANEGNTLLGTDMTIKSLTVSGSNAVTISGSDPDPLLPATDTLTISGTSGTTGITIDSGAGLVKIAADLYLSGSSQTITVNNVAGMLVSGNLGGTNGLITSGSGTLTLTGSDDFGDGSVDTENGTLAIQSGGSVFDLTSYIGNNAGSSGLVTVTGSNSTWTGDGDFYVGNSGTGTLLITSGGTVYNDNAVSNIGATIGENAGSSGMVTVTGSNSAWIDYGDLYVGDSGSGTLLITSGGTVYNFYNNFGATIGENAGSSGLVTVTGTNSTWIDYGGLYVGDSGSGTLLITSGGRVHNTGFGATIGENAGSSGLVTVTGTSSSWADYGDLYVGDSGSGTLLIENGGTVYNFVTDFGATILGATIGENAGSSGLVSVTNSAWIDFGDLFVGDSGSGTLVISNGGYVSNSVYNIGGVIGNGAGSSGMVTVTGSNSTWIAYGDLFVGDSGSGTLVISNGGYVSNGVYFNLIGGVIGNAAGSSGLVRVSGSGSAWIDDGDLYAGNSGAGKLVITRGGFVLDYNGYVGFNPGSSGMVTVSGTGSTWTNFGDVYVGGNTTGAGGAGTLSITNGGLVDAYQTTVWTSGTLAFGENSTLESPLSVNGGTVTLVDGQVQTVTLTNQVTIGAGSKLNFDVGNGSDQIALSEAGLLTVTGPVTVNLTGISGQVTAGTDVIIGADTSGYLSLGNIYNSGNFTYSLLYTPLSEDVIVAPATALTTAYWKGGVSNVWSILAGGTATNWTTDQAGTNDPHLTPSATTDVIFSANTPANQGNTVLGTDMTIKSLTVSDTNALVISGSDPNSMRGTDTLTISGSTGATGVTVSAGAGLVTIGANLYLTGSSQTVAVSNPAGLLVSGSLGGTGGLIKSGTGTLVLTGDDAFAGATTIIGGMVIVSGSLTRTMSATVAAGAAQEVDGMLNLSATSTVSGALSGAGSVGAVTVKGGGYLSPGLRSPVSQALENALQISAEDGSLGQGPADSSDQEADSTALATGTLTASGNVTFNEGSNFSIRLGVASTEDNDQLSIVNGGTVALNGANLQLTLGSFMQDAAIGAMYVIISGGAADTGARFDNTFEQGSSITEPGGYSFDILYAANADGRDIGSGSDVVLELIAVPEPGTWAMIAWGLTMLIAMRKVRGRRCGAPAEFNPRGRPPVRN